MQNINRNITDRFEKKFEKFMQFSTHIVNFFVIIILKFICITTINTENNVRTKKLKYFSCKTSSYFTSSVRISSLVIH